MNSDGGQPQLENAPSAPELAPALVQAQNTHIGTDSAQDEHNDLDHNADASKRPLTLFEKAKQHQVCTMGVRPQPIVVRVACETKSYIGAAGKKKDISDAHT